MRRGALAIVLVALVSFLAGTATGLREIRQTDPLAAAKQDPKSSLILDRAGSGDYSPRGKMAGRLLLAFLEKKEPRFLDDASRIIETLIPREESWSRYLGLKWLCSYFKAGEEEKARCMSDKAASRIIRFFSPKDFGLLKSFLRRKCRAGGLRKIDEPTEGFCELMCFSNPLRDDLDRSDQLIRAMGLRNAHSIADIGCGTGFYTFRFSQVVGNEGRVHALDIQEQYIHYLKDVIREEGIRNIIPRRSLPSDSQLERRSVDFAFLCYVYSGLYSCVDEPMRRSLIESIRKGLKPGGRLVIHENPPEVKDEVPFSTSGISADLIIDQMEEYGFRMERMHWFSAQAYLLIFRAGRYW
jgi:SAM-dependent methyltransferase